MLPDNNKIQEGKKSYRFENGDGYYIIKSGYSCLYTCSGHYCQM